MSEAISQPVLVVLHIAFTLIHLEWVYLMILLFIESEMFDDVYSQQS